MKNQSENVAALLNPPLGKKPNLTQKQIKNMRMVLQSVTIDTPTKNTYFYNIVQKQSNWGFSSHQRLLILNVQGRAISYLSSVPQGYLPYTKYQQLAANKVKQKVIMSETKQFRCNIIKGKISSISIQWLDNQNTQKKWVLTLGSSKLMNDWVGLINSVRDNSFDKNKYDEMGRVNNQSLLVNGNNNNNSSSQSPINDKQPIVNNNSQPISTNNKQAYNPFKQTQNNLSPNVANTNNNNNNQLQNSNINNSSSQLPNKLSQSKLTNNNNPQPYQSVIHPKPVPILNKVNNLSSNNNNNESDFSKKSKLAEPINTSNKYQSSTSPNNINNNNNFGSNYTEQPNRNQSQQQQFRTQAVNNNSNSRQSLPILTKTVNYSNSNHGNNYSPTSSNNINQQSLNPNSRTLNPSQSLQPADFVEQLKRNRLKNPQRFVLNNQLSVKKLQQQQNNHYQSSQNQPQQQQQYQPAYYDSGNTNNQLNNKNYGTTPINTKANIQRVNNSQTYFNTTNSNNQKQPLPYQQQQQLVKTFSRTKINPNVQSNRDLTPLIITKNQSKSQLSKSSQRNLQFNPSLGGDNNYDTNQMLQQDQDRYNQLYKPNTSFPQSTKNLNKIRSDYLRKKMNQSGSIIDSRVDSNNYNNLKIYPQTSKHQGRMLINDDDTQQQQYYPQQQQPLQQQSLKYDSNQRKRQDSLQNLNKVNSAYLSSKSNNNNNKNNKPSSHPSYNQLWLQTSNPNKKIEVYDQFITKSRQLVKAIVQQIPFPLQHRQYQPIDSSNKQNMYKFAVENIIIKLHFFNQQQSINGSQDEINVDAPVLYNHATFQQIKREFYNYNLILSVTGNQGKIKVPLCCYIQYRGVLAVVKADIPQAYRQIQPFAYSDQFQALENITKVRFMFNTFTCFESQGYRGGEGKFIMLWNLVNLIPGIPNGLKNDTSYFRKQLLLQYDEILQDLECSSQAHAFTLRHILPELLTKLQSLEIQILHTTDLTRQFHRVGLSLSYLPQMYKQTQSLYLKRIFMSEIVTQIFTEVVRSQLNHAFSILPAQNMSNADPRQIDSVIVSCAHILINQFFSYTQRSQSIWKLIVKQASKRYRIIVSKQDVVPGYILSGIVHKLSLECDFKQKSFLKNKKFFIHQNILPREVFLTFLPNVRRFDMQTICPTYSKCKQLIENDELSAQNYQDLAIVLNIKNRVTQLPQYYSPLLQQLKTYLANFIPYTMQQQYQKLDVYQFMYQQPITYNGIKSAFLAIKWLIKGNQIQKANQVFEIKFHELSYWVNEYNTAITQFYDFFSMFYASVGDFEESICLGKSSLINISKVLGQGALPVADKHYQLGNIYFKVNKKNEALKQYSKTKQILINHQKTTIPEYGIILLKISLLCLNFGQLTQCLGNAIQAQRIFQNNGGNENQEVQCFEILSRVYEITRKQQDMFNLCEACSKTFNNTQNPKIMERMLKIITYPKLSQLSSQEQKCLQPILQKLYQQRSNNTSSTSTYEQSFNYLHKLALRNMSIKKRLYNYLQNVIILADQINRKDLIRKHVSFNQRATGQAEQMLVVIEAIGNMVGWGYLVGVVKQAAYD